jgi:hypothetical protein
MMVRPTPAQMILNDVGYTTLLAEVEIAATLMRRFTTVRDECTKRPAALQRKIDRDPRPGRDIKRLPGDRNSPKDSRTVLT